MAGFGVYSYQRVKGTSDSYITTSTDSNSSQFISLIRNSSDGSLVVKHSGTSLYPLNSHPRFYLFATKSNSTTFGGSNNGIFTTDECYTLGGKNGFEFYTTYNSKVERVGLNALCVGVRCFVDQNHFNSFIKTNSTYRIWAIGMTDSHVIIAHCDDLGQIRRVNRVESLSYTNLSSFSAQQINAVGIFDSDDTSFETNLKSSGQQSGFFLNAGYYARNNGDVIENSSWYMGVNDSSSTFMTSSYQLSKSGYSSLSSYDSIYQLYSDGDTDAADEIHYTVIKSSSSSNSGSGSGGGTSNVDDTAINSFESALEDYANYANYASSVSANYISDFRDWNLKFIPYIPCESITSTETETCDFRIVENHKVLNLDFDFVNRTRTAENGHSYEDGEENEDRIFTNDMKNTEITLPLMSLNKREIDLLDFCAIIDEAIRWSLPDGNVVDSYYYALNSAGSLSSFDERLLLPYIVKIVPKEDGDEITLSTYFSTEIDENDTYRGKYDFSFYKLHTSSTSWSYRGEDEDDEEPLEDFDFSLFLDEITDSLYNILVEKKGDYSYRFDVELSTEQERETLNLYSLELFEAYTRGHDFIQENYTTVRAEERDPEDDSETSKIMSFEDNYFTYKYTGRDIDIFGGKAKEDCFRLTMGYENKEKLAPIYCAAAHSTDILLESDVTLGETYGEYLYFIEAARVPEWEVDENGNPIVEADDDYYIKKTTGNYIYKDTFKSKDYLDEDDYLFDPTEYSEEDIEVLTCKIDLTQCEYYEPLKATTDNGWCDCMARTDDDGEPIVECIYQKLGYCPYRFETEKHPRRIRTLEQSKSNRFNLIQELCKVFEFYPYFYIEHENNGKVKLDENGNMKKHVFFMTEKGSENYAGFRYEKNLSSVTRTLDSSSITTKLYVESIDSEYSDTGLCSIQTATDNIGLTSYILDFSYYTKMGMLDAEQVQRDIYGIDTGDFAFLPRIGEYNGIYDDYSNLIITMTGETLTELEAEITVCTEGITTALEERQSVAQTMYQFKTTYTTTTTDSNGTTTTLSYTTSDSYKNYVAKYREQASILWGNVETLFFSNDYFSIPVAIEVNDETIYKFYTLQYGKSYSESDALFNQINSLDGSVLSDDGKEWWLGTFRTKFNSYSESGKYCKEELFWRLLMEGFTDDDEYEPPFAYWQEFNEEIVEPKLYEINGSLGEYKSLYNEVKYWKRERAKILNKINDLSEQFYQKYEPYIKEGTFTDSNYTTDNEYYWAGVSVLDDSCEPQVSYTFKVIDLAPLEIFRDDYTFEIADTTYIEDIDFFGVNSHTGFPNREKVIISSIEYNLDEPKSNSITLQNYTSQFDDLFEAVTASVQSLTYNENVYKRASNFTAKQYVSTESLQSTLDIGDLTLLDTANENIVLDESGTEGNDIDNTASQYKITGEGIYFSTDGGETWDYGVGAEGINLDYAKFGSLDASKIQIVDGDYIYFLWDKDGINAYRNPSTSTDGLKDFARFNRYGLSLIEDDSVRLRAGYEYKSNPEGGRNTTGDYSEELELTTQNVGFYLYNEKGQPIFKTETNSLYSDSEDTDYSARLSINGEIFATNRVLDADTRGSATTSTTSTTKVYTLSKAYRFHTNSTANTNEYVTATPILRSLASSISGVFDSSSYTGYLVYMNSNFYDSITFNTGVSSSDIDGYTYKYTVGDTTSMNFYCVSTVNSTNDTYLVDAKYYQLSSVAIYNNISSTTITLDSSLIEDIFVALGSGENEIEIEVNGETCLFYCIKEKNLTTMASGLYYTNEESTEFCFEVKDEVVYTLYYYDEDETYNTSSYTIQTLDYIEVDSSGNIIAEKSGTFYMVSNSSGGKTYYSDIADGGEASTEIEVSSDFSLSEVGIFINNKKTVDEDYSEESIDLIDIGHGTDSTTIESNNEQYVKILMGSERVFSISSALASSTELKTNNVLTVLKNGILYMGGEIKSQYGTDLDIASLQYLPDEISIQNPKIIMTNNGQIFCDWYNFFMLGLDDDGNIYFTNYSLGDFYDQAKSSFSSLSGSSGSTTGVSGYYIDEADVDANV